MADDGEESTRPKLAPHILPIAGTMLGICTTLIGLVKVFETRVGPSHVDEYGGLVAIVFLMSALSSYTAMRTENSRPRFSRRLERVADLCFVSGLICLSAVACSSPTN